MKHWAQPELMELNVSETACGFPGSPDIPVEADTIPVIIPEVVEDVSRRSLPKNRKNS